MNNVDTSNQQPAKCDVSNLPTPAQEQGTRSDIRSAAPSRKRRKALHDREMGQLQRVLEYWEATDRTFKEQRLTSCLADIAEAWTSLKGRRGLPCKRLRTRLLKLVHTLYIEQRLSYHRLQEVCGFTQSYLSQEFNRLDLPTRSCGEKTPYAGDPHRLYAVNHDALDDLKDPLVAYLLGFLWADGRVLSRDGRPPEGIRVVVNERDEEILELIKHVLGSDAPIHWNKTTLSNGRRYRGRSLSIYSHHLAKRLISLGFMEREGGRGNASLPSIPKEVEVDFWRGVCDGDGHIKRDPRTIFPLSGWELGISGSKELVEQFRQFVEHELGFQPAVVRNGNSQYNQRAYVTGVRTPKLANLLYPKHVYKTALSRKYRLARALADAREVAGRHGIVERQTTRALIYTNTEPCEPAVRAVLSAYLPKPTR